MTFQTARMTHFKIFQVFWMDQYLDMSHSNETPNFSYQLLPNGFDQDDLFIHLFILIPRYCLELFDIEEHWSS